MKGAVIFYGHFVYFTAKWYILWPFGTLCDHLVYFFPVLVSCTETNLATLCQKLQTKKIETGLICSLLRYNKLLTNINLFLQCSHCFTKGSFLKNAT
jgi:hypothetical protein